MMHSFDASLAAKYGVEEAILIHAFQFWIRTNRNEGRNHYEHRTWSFNSYGGLAAEFPYWKEHQIRRIVASLVSQGVLRVAQIRKARGDMRNWYAFEEEDSFLPNTVAPTHHTIPSDGLSKSSDGLSKSSDVSKVHLGTPLENSIKNTEEPGTVNESRPARMLTEQQVDALEEVASQHCTAQIIGSTTRAKYAALFSSGLSAEDLREVASTSRHKGRVQTLDYFVPACQRLLEVRAQMAKPTPPAASPAKSGRTRWRKVLSYENGRGIAWTPEEGADAPMLGQPGCPRIIARWVEEPVEGP